METNEFIHYLAVFEKDNRLSSWHIAILAAVLTLALRQGRVRSIKASRSKIMTLSHINTFPTYHKYFKGLQEIGYIRYRPSYHPGLRSEIDLIKQPFD